MKNSTKVWNEWVFNKQFIIWLMRVSFTTLLLIIVTLQFITAASVKGQRLSNHTITIRLENENLLSGLKKIEAQTSFRFYYRKAEVSEIVGLNLSDEMRTVENTLYELLKNTDFTFRQINNNILLEKRKRQTGFKISGRVRGLDHKILSLVSIQLLKLNSRQLIASAIADTGGRFNVVTYESGDYLLKVGSATTDSLVQKITVQEHEKSIQLLDIILAGRSIQLNDVTIKGKRKLIDRTADKLTLNVEGSLYEKGEDALKLFNVVPGVQVTGREILFRGSESVTVYIDNRKIPLSGDQLFAYLRGIPSESIMSYELKAVPGAENDAQHGGVIINIVLKSDYKYGLTGNLGGGYWYTKYNSMSGSTFLNYRTGKLNMQAGLNYRQAPAFYEHKITQQFKSTGVFSPQTEKYTEDYYTIGYNLGLDYKLDDHQTLGLDYNLFSNPGDMNNQTITKIDYLSNVQTSSIDSSLYTNKSTKFSYSNHMANVFYRNKLDTVGSKLDLGYSYIYYGLDDPSAIESKFLDHAGAESQPRDSLFAQTLGRSKVHVVNADLEKHLSKSLVLNIGGKYTFAKTDYSIDYRNGLDAQSPLNSELSNGFLYKESIMAFYSTVAKSFKQWEFKIGLRAEETSYEGQPLSSGQAIKRSQWDLFPSGYLNRKVGDHHAFTFSYARRIDRPGFRQLNPFVVYTNLNTVQMGNPNLRPYYSHNVQMEYLLKNKYSLTTGYQKTKDGIATNVTNMHNVILSRDENISDNDNVFASLYIPVRLTKWWELNANLTIRYRTLEVQGTTQVQRSKFTQNIWARSRFSLPGQYAFEISGFFNSNNFYDIYDQFSVMKLDFAVKKSFFKDKLTVSAELQDPFHLYKSEYEINTPGFKRNVLTNRVDWARYAGIWLTYNFSKGKKTSNRENYDAAGNDVRTRL